MKKVIIMLTALTVAACAEGQYGRSAPYRDWWDEKIDVNIPANAPVISQQFRKGRNSEGDHNGIDLLAGIGTPVLAPAPGRVLKIIFDPMFGRQMHVDHGLDEQGRGVVTHYVHLSGTVAEVGDQVERGQQIAMLGRTGLLSGGLPHLHFEVWRTDSSGRDSIDPHLMWANGVGNVTCYSPAVEVPEGVLKFTLPLQCR